MPCLLPFSPVFFQNIVLDPPELDLSNGPRELLRAASQPVSVEISNSEPIRIPETVSVGSRIARVLASDKDTGDNSKIFYRIVSENNNPIGGKFSYLTDKQYLYSRNKDKHFVIDRITGEISVAKPLKPDTEYALNISASDRGGLRAYTGIKVVVQDVSSITLTLVKSWQGLVSRLMITSQNSTNLGTPLKSWKGNICIPKLEKSQPKMEIPA